MIGLDQTAAVYTPNPATGAYDVLARSNLACRLALTSATTGMGGERVELASGRRLLWDAVYDMPETAQVLVDGVRWNVQAGSFAAVRGPDSQTAYRRCDVTRAL